MFTMAEIRFVFTTLLKGATTKHKKHKPIDVQGECLMSFGSCCFFFFLLFSPKTGENMMLADMNNILADAP